MKNLEASEITESVRKRYGEIAIQGKSGCGCAPSGSCCGPSAQAQSTSSLRVGYSEADVLTAPVGSDLGLGCGNPHAIAALRAGEVVLDLGSGSGFDARTSRSTTGIERRAVINWRNIIP